MGWGWGHRWHTALAPHTHTPLASLRCGGFSPAHCPPSPAAGSEQGPSPGPMPAPSPCSPAAAPAPRRSGRCRCRQWPGCGGIGGRRARRHCCNMLRRFHGSRCCGRMGVSRSWHPSCARLSPRAAQHPPSSRAGASLQPGQAPTLGQRHPPGCRSTLWEPDSQRAAAAEVGIVAVRPVCAAALAWGGRAEVSEWGQAPATAPAPHAVPTHPCPPALCRPPRCPHACPRPLTPAGEPGPRGRGGVVVPGTVHALNALVPVDDLEDLADEGAGLLGGILQRDGGREGGNAGGWVPSGGRVPSGGHTPGAAHPVGHGEDDEVGVGVGAGLLGIQGVAAGVPPLPAAEARATLPAAAGGAGPSPLPAAAAGLPSLPAARGPPALPPLPAASPPPLQAAALSAFLPAPRRSPVQAADGVPALHRTPQPSPLRP